MLSLEGLKRKLLDSSLDPYQVFDEEAAWLRKRRVEAQLAAGKPDKDAVGLALSGGGVRSATFNLGILQAMERYVPAGAKRSFLRHVDYLSTVSGGGYIGSALTWLVSRTGSFPFGTSRRDNVTADHKETDSSVVVRWLRRHGKYLTPGDGLNTWALVAAALRGILLNLVISIPLFYVLAALLAKPVAFVPPQNLVGMLPPWLTTIFSNVSQWFAHDDFYRLVFLAGLAALVLLLALFFLSGLFSMTFSQKYSFYSSRLFFHKLYGRLIWIGVALLLVGSLPLVLALIRSHVDDGMAHLMGLGGMSVPGALAALFSWWGRTQQTETRGWRPILVTVGLMLMLYGLGLWLTGVALGPAPAQAALAEGWRYAGTAAVLNGLFWPAVILLVVANINNVSMHRFYRDRLMQAYMPAIADDGSLADADKFRLCDIPVTWAPYHIINANLMTLDSRQHELHARGGENFILSPLYCGSVHTGYTPTHSYVGGQIDLGTALAVSGAAVEPNTGSTRSRPLAALMTLLNVRLGYWILNPANPFSRSRYGGTWLAYLFSYMNIFSELIGRGLNEKRPYVHLSDGGHYENLALYELIRRKLPYIIACDAGCDPDWDFGDLAHVIELVRVDFGAKVEIDTQPLHPNDNKGGIGISDHASVTGTITYRDGSKSRLLYIKSTLVAGLPEDVYGYRRRNPKFPDQPTLDQFFDEPQFEAYRELGFQIGRLAFAGKSMREVFAPRPRKKTRKS